MFDPDTLREAFCVIAMESLHREGIELNTPNVYDRICHLCMLPANFTAEFMALRKIALDANITKPKQIAPTVRRLLTELLKTEGTLII